MKKISLFLVITLVVSLFSAYTIDEGLLRGLSSERINSTKTMLEEPGRNFQASSARVLRTIEKKGIVNVNGLNVRSAGSMKGKIIGVINKGVEVHVFNEQDRWYYVEYAKDKRGWVYASYVNVKWDSPAPSPGLKKIEKHGYVTVNGLNVRSLASMKGKVVAVINKGLRVYVEGEKDGWYYIEYAKGKKAWVYSKYIEFREGPPPKAPDLKKIEKNGYVNVNGLNVRHLGSMKGIVVSSLNKNRKVYVFGSKEGWYYIEYAKNKRGWVYAKYVNVEWTSPSTDGLSNKSYSWYFIRKTNHVQPGFDSTYKSLLDKYNGITIGSKDKKDIFLTMDLGYESGYTSRILDILKRQNVKVGFFVQGTYIDNNPSLVKRMVSEGHIVLNHTNNHPNMPTLTKADLEKEIKVVAEKYKKLTGKDMHKFFRPPSGVFSERTLAITKNLGYRTVFWSMAYHDWDPNNQPGKAAAYKHVTDNIHNGAVMLLHGVSKSNTEALEDIIKELKRRGYNFKLLTQFP